MKIFLSFRYTGYSRDDLREFFQPILKALEDAGHEVYCFLQDEEDFLSRGTPMKDMFEHVFAKLRQSDVLLVVVRSNDRSEGMLMEVGFAKALGKRIVLLKSAESATYIETVAGVTANFNDQGEMVEKVNQLI